MRNVKMSGDFLPGPCFGEVDAFWRDHLRGEQVGCHDCQSAIQHGHYFHCLCGEGGIESILAETQRKYFYVRLQQNADQNLRANIALDDLARVQLSLTAVVRLLEELLCD